MFPFSSAHTFVSLLEWKRYDEFTDVVKDTQKHLHDYKKALNSLTATETALSECWASIFDTSSQLYNAYAKNIVFSGQMEQLRIQLDEDLLRDFDEPLDLYMVQFKQLKKRDAERTRRKVDSDRLLYDYEKLQRAGKDLEKVEPLRLQSEGMQLYYERLNNELKRDLPAIIDDRALFYTPLFANWIFHIHEYYRMASGNLGPLLSTVQNVDMSQMHLHPHVITSEEASFYNVEIKDATPVDMDAAPMSTQGEEGDAPPQGGYDTSFYASQQQQPVDPGGYAQPYATQNSGPPLARAVYAFAGQDGSELSFSEGEMIEILDQSAGEWWQGRLRGKTGLLPANYVQLI